MQYRADQLASHACSPKDWNARVETLAHRQLLQPLASLTLDECTDGKALAWHGRQTVK